ncbi:MAG: hypothetical protein ABJ370_17160 [Paracoccaceae bacterium]
MTFDQVKLVEVARRNSRKIRSVRPLSKQLFIYGDSIIDNGNYVGSNEPHVVQQISSLLSDWDVISFATDGARCADIAVQLKENPAPSDAHILLTGGGNDALDTMWVLEDDTDRTFPEVLGLLVNIKEQFRTKYLEVLAEIKNRQTLVATIYNPMFEHPSTEPIKKPSVGMLTAYNDVIQEEACAAGHSILELRRLFIHAEHFANPIEPSALGGAVIANATTDWLAHQKKPLMPRA